MAVLLVEEIGVPGENHWPVAGYWQTLSHNHIMLYRVLIAWVGFELATDLVPAPYMSIKLAKVYQPSAHSHLSRTVVQAKSTGGSSKAEESKVLSVLGLSKGQGSHVSCFPSPKECVQGTNISSIKKINIFLSLLEN